MYADSFTCSYDDDTEGEVIILEDATRIVRQKGWMEEADEKYMYMYGGGRQSQRARSHHTYGLHSRVAIRQRLSARANAARNLRPHHCKV